MVLGDFGAPHGGGFDSVYSKTVDQPCHFRQRPKNSKVGPQSVERRQPSDMGSMQRYACRHRDHSDLLTSNSGSGPTFHRPSVRCAAKYPTELVSGREVGGSVRRGQEPLHVGKKQIAPPAAVVNIADASKMPSAVVYSKKKDGEFSGLRSETLYSDDPAKFIQPPKGKKLDTTRRQRTTGDCQWLTWQ